MPHCRPIFAARCSRWIVVLREVRRQAVAGLWLESSSDESPESPAAPKKVATCQSPFDGQNKISSGLRFQYVALRPNVTDFGRKPIRIMHGEHQNARTKTPFVHALRHFEAARARHRDIQNRDVRLQVRDCAQSLGSIRSLSADFPFGS